MLQTVAQNGAKLAILVAKLANIAPSWRHPGRSWRQDGSQGASKWSSRGSPDRILSFWRPEVRRTAPRPALDSNFPRFSSVLGSIFISFGIDFGMAWEGFWKICFSFLALSVPCQTRSHTPWRPKRTQDEPKTELRRLSWLILAIFVPTSCQEAPNLKPTSAKMGQLVAKIAQNSSSSSSRPPPHPSKTKQK